MRNLSRHQFLKFAAATSMGVAMRARSQGTGASAIEPKASAPAAGAEASALPEVSKKAWMDTWMEGARAVKGGLYLFRFKDPIWSLTKPIQWSPATADASKQWSPATADASKYKTVKVPTGFVTDLASIPPIFFSVLRPDGIYTYPAIVHDYMYWTQNCSKDIADEIFRLAMKEFDVPKLKLEAIFDGVSVFGQGAWNKNAELKKSGEKRILKKFPEDPLMTWEQWKKEPGVFAAAAATKVQCS